MSIKSFVNELMVLSRRRWRLSTRLQCSIVRSVILVTSTVVLLIARIRVMGAQLPVFTRYTSVDKLDYYHCQEGRVLTSTCPSVRLSDCLQDYVKCFQAIFMKPYNNEGETRSPFKAHSLPASTLQQVITLLASSNV